MNWLDILISIIALYSILKGYKSGLVRQLVSLVAIVACILLSGKISTILLPHIHKIEVIPSNFTEPASFILSFVLILAILFLLGHMLESILKTVKLGSLNKLAGAILSLSKWMLLVSMALNLFVKIDQNHLILSSESIEKSKAYQYIKPIAPKVAPYLNFDFNQAYMTN